LNYHLKEAERNYREEPSLSHSDSFALDRHVPLITLLHVVIGLSKRFPFPSAPLPDYGVPRRLLPKVPLTCQQKMKTAGGLIENFNLLCSPIWMRPDK
jgi:hypothetical protein